MSRTLLIALGLLSSVAVVAPAFAKDPAGKTFITKAIQGNLAEVQMGQLAKEKSQNGDVKAFGQQLMTDHNDANAKATAVAKDIGVTPPDSKKKDPTASYASDTLPTLQKHLEMAQSLTKSLASK
jgi:putative membrane protein